MNVMLIVAEPKSAGNLESSRSVNKTIRSDRHI